MEFPLCSASTISSNWQTKGSSLGYDSLESGSARAEQVAHRDCAIRTTFGDIIPFVGVFSCRVRQGSAWKRAAAKSLKA